MFSSERDRVLSCLYISMCTKLTRELNRVPSCRYVFIYIYISFVEIRYKDITAPY